jgi:hypothetical protein
MPLACLHPRQPCHSWTTARSNLAAFLSYRTSVAVEERGHNPHAGQLVLDTTQRVAGEQEGQLELGGV